MKLFNTITVITVSSALMLGGCITYPDGTQKTSKTAMYGLGGAAACGIIGALTHGGKGARNSALACGAVGAGIGGYMDYQEKKLRESLANTGVDVERNGNQIKLVMPENVTFPTNSSTLNANAQNALAAAAQTRHHADRQRPYRQHRLRRHQRSVVATPRPSRCFLPAITRRECFTHEHIRPRLPPADCLQRHR